MNTTRIKQTIIVISIILALLLTGCSGLGNMFSSGSGNIQSYNFRTGTDGLDMKFQEGAPPKKLYIGTDFIASMKIKNNGAYSIKDRAIIKISMPDQSVYQFKEGNTKPFILDGKSLYAKEGQEDVVTFPLKALCYVGYDGSRESIVRNYTSKIRATACYYYETTANIDLCIDTNKLNRPASEKALCQMKDVSTSGGQGGPVGLSGVSVNMIPQSEKQMLLQLGISIKKLKGTEVTIFHPDIGCGLEGQNNITIEVELGGEIMQCTPDIIQIKEKDVSTICKKVISSTSGTYTSPLAVKMRYYVQQNTMQDINIEPPPGGVDCAALKSANK